MYYCQYNLLIREQLIGRQKNYSFGGSGVCLCVLSSSLYVCIWYTGEQFADNLSEEDL